MALLADSIEVFTSVSLIFAYCKASFEFFSRVSPDISNWALSVPKAEPTSSKLSTAIEEMILSNWVLNSSEAFPVVVVILSIPSSTSENASCALPENSLSLSPTTDKWSAASIRTPPLTASPTSSTDWPNSSNLPPSPFVAFPASPLLDSTSFKDCL